MSDLIEFLRARLAEDEHLANELRKTCPHVDNCGDGEPDWDVVLDASRRLREIEAKRRILDEHALMWRDIGWLEDDEGERVEAYAELEVCARCVPKHSHFGSRAAVSEGPCKTVRLLALPYADHPDYRPEWRP